ncbi:cysteine--tRNA ligase [Parvicella tangerina]|uniref:Cysteine--tRNA ligase n=1 Tax=Parvicella tangerina TaxID=2829795 RepID=A0A916NQ88_9FLAO|nr:cysteine--tRNA ligase [Parvicella tangerina]CAG5078497.1 Cysteine--tRNA ligase [Parvicella tangerina]
MAKFENQTIYIYNSLTGKKERFEPINAPHLGIYVCGPTVYSNVHLGNCRTFLSFDTIIRYFKFLEFKVRYVRNITDAGHLTDDGNVDNDRFVKQSRLEKLEPMEIVQKYSIYFHDIMKQFNALPPSIEPTATGHIMEQIEMIQTILDKGLAYESNGSIYFDVKKYMEQGGEYGELSGRDIEELMSGSRDLDGQDEKRNPTDFALWKKASPQHIMRWNSPWSDGFPGWHLECSAMGKKYLGNQFDIHGGGMDLKFPHHECEIAQGKSANGCAPVRYWMHGNMLTLNGKRMSKSTGNTILPHELFSGDNDIMEKAFSPAVVRFFMLQAHYRSVLDFSSDALMAAEKGYKKMMAAYDLLEKVAFKSTALNQQEDASVKELCDTCYKEMNDDFNTPKTIAALFELVAKINSFATNNSFGQLSEETFAYLQETFFGMISDVFGLQKEESGNTDVLDKSLQILIDMRAQAKRDRNFAMADEIRDRLLAAGVQLKDGKEGTTYSI